MRLSPRNEDRLVFYLLAAIAIGFMLTIICVQPADAAIPDLDQSQAVERTETGDWALLVSRYWTGADFDTAMSIMECESGGDPHAVSATDDHGLFQHNRYWSSQDDRFEKAGYSWADRYNPEANVAAAFWLWSESGWSPWACNRIVGRGDDWFEPVTIDLLADPHPGR